MSAPRRVVKLLQFSGSYLNVAWTRKFILGSLLQRYNPTPAGGGGAPAAAAAAAAAAASSPSPKLTREGAALEKELLRLQRMLGEVWSLPVRPLDAVSESRILRLLARYAAGDGVLATDALEELNRVLACIHGAPRGVEDPRRMERLLQALQYVEPDDNLRRVAFAGELHYPPSALAHMQSHLTEELQQDGGDPFDGLRQHLQGPAYAIDSATTSEVDDAIGVHTDPATGKEYFVVYVSDATVYCPFDSALEQLTARLLTTTTYLPEGVFFMLPKPIVEAATLREDRPCRTFNIRFQIDDATGELKNYSVGVGWLKQLRRLTYDAVQALYDSKGEGEETAAAALPPWVAAADVRALHRIHAAALKRLEGRRARSPERFIDANLPEPRITVAATRVLSVEDQVVATKDARLAVAEMMIAANEVCSRVAQANHLPIPYRGTRELSMDHEAARFYREPQGVTAVASLDPQYVYFAEAIQHAIRQLSAVTRAVYFHTPIHHAGLNTYNYTHSTSPLRRYADMLVHHQLKMWLWRTSAQNMRRAASPASRKGAPLAMMIDQPIAEHTMATLCSMISNKQEQSRILQDSSQRYWLLRHIEQNILTKDRNHRFICLVGDTRGVESAPEYTRFMDSPHLDHSRAENEVGGASTPATLQGAKRTVPLRGRWQQRRHEYRYVSDIYIPELQFAHVVLHSLPNVVIGAVVECGVVAVHPTQGQLTLRVVSVWEGGDERRFEGVWKRALLPTLDS
ncbi:putative mitochondrial exoribonuclease DSS-1 [Trypanosoma conorhini]|uniref:Putative mitochondrial exoribonuclease DSS-1 n=1 Tax=Trypanosoma conorhini TaxID=83891 RepID=A0A422PLM3_9TRYP|nr:putative mitochondrial exoribonuclease DSS-1 [Trypanosoma conorhini]RNF18619.1 putative mitochondrial exoribonuclease DSS-1 [Trypanosoma conorhini]